MKFLKSINILDHKDRISISNVMLYLSIGFVAVSAFIAPTNILPYVALGIASANYGWKRWNEYHAHDQMQTTLNRLEEIRTELREQTEHDFDERLNVLEAKINDVKQTATLATSPFKGRNTKGTI